MNNSKFNDFKFGKEKELEELAQIKARFGEGLEKTKSTYSVFDFQADDCFVELKSRRNTLDKYPDTMVGYNKLVSAEKQKEAVYFVFSFTDGLYFWKYNGTDLCNGNVEVRRGGRKDRGNFEYKDYAFIKTNILEKV